MEESRRDGVTPGQGFDAGLVRLLDGFLWGAGFGVGLVMIGWLVGAGAWLFGVHMKVWTSRPKEIARE